MTELVLVSPPVHGDEAPALAPLELEAALAELLPEERALHDALAPGRRATFLAGRVALRRALDRLAAPRDPILTDARGAPTLPTGFTGSIAHKPGLAGAACAPSDGFALGLDVELLRPPRVSIAKRVLTEAELAEGGDEAIAVIGRFALKEAIYKAVDRFVGRYVGFHEAELLELVVPPASSLASPSFVETPAVMRMREGAFGIEARWARAEGYAIALATARRA